MTDKTPSADELARQLEIAEEKGRIKAQEEQKERELAVEKARKKELEEQRERELAMEKGRKKGQEEEKARHEKRGLGTGTKIVLSLIVIVLIVALAAFLTISVSVTTVTPGNSMPYSTAYSVTFPEGQTITIGNSQIAVLSYQGDLITDIDGNREKLAYGQNRQIGERRAVVTTLGSLKLVDTIFLIDLVYKGDRDNQAYFDMTIHTSKQIPNVLLQKLLPAAIDARPI
jgi:hypothetical protein